jgi:hypothetical protein
MGKAMLFHRQSGEFWLSSDPEQPGNRNCRAKVVLSPIAQNWGDDLILLPSYFLTGNGDENHVLLNVMSC